MNENDSSEDFTVFMFEFGLDLLPLLVVTDNLSLNCIFEAPVTTSKMVGRSFIILNRRFLHPKPRGRKTKNKENNLKKFKQASSV